MRMIRDIALIVTATTMILIGAYTLAGIWPYAGVRAF